MWPYEDQIVVPLIRSKYSQKTSLPKSDRLLAADQDAIAEAARLSILAGASLTFRKSGAGSGAAFKSLSKAAGDLRSGKKNRAEFDEADRQAQLEQPPLLPPDDSTNNTQ